MRRAIIALIFLTFSVPLLAQYTYIDANFGYHNLRFKRVDDGELENIALNEFRLNLSPTYRLNKRFGVGVTLGLPIISGFNSNYRSAPTSDNTPQRFDGEDLASFGAYPPSEFQHDLQNPYTISIYPRVYFGEESTVYFDLRYNLMRISEQFTFVRPAQNTPNGAALASRNIRYDESFTVSGFGIRVGVENKFAEHWTFSYGLILDYYNFDQHDPFEYNIEYSENNSTFNYMVLGSAVQGQDISWQFGYGIAYVF